MAVDDDERTRWAVDRELRHRYEPDYEVISTASPEAGIEILTKLADAGREVIVVLADQCMPGMTGTEFLTRARHIYPASRRFLLISWGDRTSVEGISQATYLGQIDDCLLKPAHARDEQFHGAISHYLEEWARTRGGGFEVVKVVGEELAFRSRELCETLARNGVQFGFHAADSPTGRQLLEQAGAASATLPVVMVFNGQTLENPSNAMIAEALGIKTHPKTALYDIAVIGAGPGGLSAAVYGASEGFATALLESEAVGGQASASSNIRNYPGFPHGISGADLAYRTFQQARVMGVDFIYGNRATGLRACGDERVVILADGSELHARTAIIATGCSYRRLGIPALEELVGAGVFYWSAVSEARALRGRDVFVVGGANSAGQVAVHLASCGANVTILSRGSSFANTMSAYLIKEIESSPAITVRYGVEVVDGSGCGCLESLTLKDRRSGREEAVPAQALFALIGVDPRTDWLPANVERDRSGFVMAGADVSPTGWPLARPPLPLETSMPSVFAIGDVRHGSIKRIAAAVGEGSIVIRLIHECLEAGCHLPELGSC